MTAVEKIKAKILDLAIRGKLVPQDPNDEPASVLLERIKAEKAKLVKAKKIKKEKNPSEIIVGADGATYEKFADGTTKDISDELPFDLPQGWAWVRMGMIISLLNGDRGKNYPSKQSLDCVGRIPFISAVNIADGNLIRRGLLYISEERFNKLRAGRLKLNDIVLCIRGSIGKFCVYPEPIGAIASSLVILRNDFGIDVNYISSYIRSSLFYREVKKFDNGTAQPNLAANDVVKFLTPLPPLAEQRRIVKKVDELFSYAGKIGESSDAIVRTADHIDKKILDLAIHGKLVPQDPSDEPASELIKRIEAARTIKAGGKKPRPTASDRPAYEIDPPFDIPDSWEWVKFGTLIQVIAGVSYQKDDVTTSGVRILRGGNIKEDARIYLHDDDVFLPAAYAEDITSVKAGDIVVVASTGSSTVIGRPAVATETLLGVQIGAFLRIVRAVDDSIMSWLPVIFLGDYYRNFIRSKSKGTNIKNLKTEYLTELPVPLPPLAEQKRIVTKIKELRAMTKSLTM